MRTSISVVASIIFAAFMLSCASPPPAADESVTVFARFDATPGREAEVEALFSKVVLYVHNAEPGASYHFYRSKKDPTVFVFYEVYANAEAADHHAKVTLPAMAREYGPPPEGLFSKPPEIARFSQIK